MRVRRMPEPRAPVDEIGPPRTGGPLGTDVNRKQAEARVARIIRRNWGLTCAFSWASHKISALHKLNNRRAGLMRIEDELENEQQIDDNPALLYAQGLSAEG